MLGTRTLMVDDPALAVRHLTATPNAIAIIEAGGDAAFTAAAQAQGVTLAALDRVAGINYSNGRRVALILYTARRP